MRHKQVRSLDKYKAILAKILNVPPEEIKFFCQENYGQKFLEVGELRHPDPDKKWEFIRTWSLGHYEVRLKKVVIGSWKLYQLPHCCGVMVSCNATVHENYRNQRIGTLLNNLRQEIARFLGYSLVLCTDIKQNSPMRKLLKTNGWKDLYEFVNKRTKNTVIISVVSV